MAKWAQGTYTVVNRAKYVGKGDPRYRSGWEFSFMKFCDSNDNVLQWASEAVQIPYRHPLTGKQTIYVPDFLITYRTRNNQVRAELIEIKPKKQSVVESKMSSRDRAVIAINYAKWDAATRWCKRQGLMFRVITEQDMFHNGRAWATKYGMTKKLEELFDLAPTEDDVNVSVPAIAENKSQLAALDDAIDKIDNALPAVRGLDATDQEMDELAGLATGTYKDLMDLGFQVDSRFASEIFSVASNMLGHAITAKTAKLDKKLKMIDLQMKKMRLDQQQQALDAKDPDAAIAAETAHGVVLSRNDLLERIIGKSQNTQKE